MIRERSLGLLVIATLLLAGCAGALPRAAPPPADETWKPATRGNGGSLNIPKYHVWSPLTGYGHEEQGYALYTYVILGWTVQDPRSPEGERYERLLEAVVQAVQTAGEALRKPGKPDGHLRRECNVFYLPLLKQELSKGASPLASYNMVLGQRIKAALVQALQQEPEIARRLDQGAGPFLVSLPGPLSTSGPRITRLLLADLSRTHPAAMKEVVAAYRKQLNAEAVDEVERFAPIKLALLNGILAINDIQLVRAALADIIPE